MTVFVPSPESRRPVGSKPNLVTIFGRNVRAARERLGISQQALARERGKTQTWLSYIETGCREPRLKDFAWLCHRLELNLDALHEENE